MAAPETEKVAAGLVLRPVNPFAIGGGFLAYCVRQGWMTQEGKGRAARYYITEEGCRALESQFGITVQYETSSP